MTEIVNGNKLLEVLIGDLFCLCFVVCLLCPILFWYSPMEINEMIITLLIYTFITEVIILHYYDCTIQ